MVGEMAGKGDYMRIGCVKEIKKLEYRVGVTPDHAKAYVKQGQSGITAK